MDDFHSFLEHHEKINPVVPVCPVFGICGGCQLQDVPYEEELALKSQYIRHLFGDRASRIDPIVPSPSPYQYRSRLDMKMLQMKSGQIVMGFSPVGRYRVVEVESCPIAMKAVSDFLPELKRLASARLPAKYRNANLTVKTGDDGRVCWGGVGRRSMRLTPDQYLWTEVRGRRIHFSLETFFQANLGILPRLMDAIEGLGVLGPDQVLWDLYGGVGLFSVALADKVRHAVLIEENVHSIVCARYNIAANRLANLEVIPGRVEEVFPSLLAHQADGPVTAMIDPPRAGLSPGIAEMIAAENTIRDLVYLSCNPVSLIRDADILMACGWRIEGVIPLDFFPRTRHIETLVHFRQKR